MNFNYGLLVLLGIAITGCATKAPHQMPEQKSEKRYDINTLMSSSEIYVVFEKNKNGTPTRIQTIEKNEKVALEFFQKNNRAINSYDCIRLLPRSAKQPNTVCNESMWFGYGKTDATRLTTRKAKDAANAVVGGVVATALTPFAVAIDVLSFDPEFKFTREQMTSAVSNPVQDYEELASVRAVLEVLFNNKVDEERKLALGNVNKTAAFIEKYPGIYSGEVVEAALEKSIQDGDENQTLLALKILPVSANQRDRGLAFLRGLNTFSGYSKAFDVSSSSDDAKKAQRLASNNNDRRQVEYMAMKVLKLKNVPLDSVFNLAIKDALSGGTVRADRGYGGFLSFKESVNSGVSDFKLSLGLSVNKALGIFKYGTYDVKVKCTLSVPQHFYRRSFWMGNVDENRTSKFSENRIVRITTPSYVSDQSFEFKDITVNYKDRGSAGGTTEITLNGKPSVECGVENVELVS